MLALRNPSEAYRRVDLEARIIGGDGRTRVLVCYEALASSLGAALLAFERGDNQAKSAGLTRAMSALTALQLGIDEKHPLSQALHQMIGAARNGVLESVLTFDPATLKRIRNDFQEIATAMA